MAARLEQQHRPVGILRQATGERAASRSGADNDEVELTVVGARGGCELAGELVAAFAQEVQQRLDELSGGVDATAAAAAEDDEDDDDNAEDGELIVHFGCVMDCGTLNLSRGATSGIAVARAITNKQFDLFGFELEMPLWTSMFSLRS